MKPRPEPQARRCTVHSCGRERFGSRRVCQRHVGRTEDIRTAASVELFGWGTTNIEGNHHGH